MSSARVTIDLAAGQIALPGSSIRMEFLPPLDKCHAYDVRLVNADKSRSLDLELKDDGRLGKVRLPEHVRGACELQIVERFEPRKERVRRRVPFSVVEVSGKLSREQRIGQAVRVQERELDLRRVGPGKGDGSFIDVVKVAAQGGEAYARLAFDEQGSTVDIDAVVARVRARRAERFGSIHEALFARIQQLNPQELIDVVIWPPVSISAAPFPKSEDEPSGEITDAESEVLEKLSSQVGSLREYLEQHDVKTRASDDDDRGYQGPYLRATATVEKVRALSKSPEIGGIFFDDTSGVEDLGRSLELSHANTVINAGARGLGVKVAVWERSPEGTEHLEIAAQHEFGADKTLHARLTTGIIKNRQTDPCPATAPVDPEEPPAHGYAPDCQIYSANTCDVKSFEWAIGRGCTVVNQSFHRASAEGLAIADADDLAKDRASLFTPFPTIVQAAGNLDEKSPQSGEYVNHKGLNSLTVGSHDENFSIALDSVFRNPNSLFGDRELPSLAANGTDVEAVCLRDSGTSFAAPAVAGVVAVLQGQDALLKSWPEGCRAIVTASAYRPPGMSTWLQDVQEKKDARIGAGCLDAETAFKIVQSRTRASGPSASVGWDVGTLTQESFDPSGALISRYLMSVPASLSIAVATVALCWSSAIRTEGGLAVESFLSVDLDLKILDTVSGQQAALSATLDNSSEVVQFYPESGRTYELVVTRSPSDDNTRFGIAWIVRES